LEAQDADDCDAVCLLVLAEYREQQVEDLQGSYNEHHGYSDLLLPVQLQVDELRHGEAKHPEIQQDADTCI
jgi:hypothetical protein